MVGTRKIYEEVNDIVYIPVNLDLYYCNGCIHLNVCRIIEHAIEEVNKMDCKMYIGMDCPYYRTEISSEVTNAQNSCAKEFKFCPYCGERLKDEYSNL